MAETGHSGSDFNVSKRTIWEDHDTGERGYSIEHTQVEDANTRITLDSFSSLLPPDVLESSDKRLAIWELRKMVARKNRDAKLRMIPEAHRRRVNRETAEKQRRMLLPATPKVCPMCVNTGWVEDLGDGTSGECPQCDSADRMEP